MSALALGRLRIVGVDECSARFVRVLLVTMQRMRAESICRKAMMEASHGRHTVCRQHACMTHSSSLSSAVQTRLCRCRVQRGAVTAIGRFLQVLAKDLYGNAVAGALNVGPGEIEASLRGPETLELTPVKREAGCLTLAYTTIKAGSYDLSITHAGRHISGSPWKVRASPGPAVAAMCSVEGLPSSVVSGQPFHFMLQTLDECKNSTVSTNSVTCEVDSPIDGIVPLDVKEVGQGVSQTLSHRDPDGSA